MIYAFILSGLQIIIFYFIRYLPIDQCTLMLTRNIFTLGFFSAKILFHYKMNQIDLRKIFCTKNLFWHIIRASIIFLVMILTYISKRLLEPGISAAIGTSEAIFVVLYTLIFSYFSFYLFYAVIVSLIGIMLLSPNVEQGILQIIDASFGSNLSIVESTSDNFFFPATLILLANAFCASVGFITKKLHLLENSICNEREKTLKIGFINTSLLILFSLIDRKFQLVKLLMLLNNQSYKYDSFSQLLHKSTDIIYLLCFCLTSAISSEVAIIVFDKVKPIVNATIQNLRPVIMIVIDILLHCLYSTPLTLSVYSFLGLILISLTAIFVSLVEGNNDDVIVKSIKTKSSAHRCCA